MNGVTKRLLDDPVGFILLLLVIGATMLREGGVIPAPWDSVTGTGIALAYAYKIVKRPTET